METTPPPTAPESPPPAEGSPPPSPSGGLTVEWLTNHSEAVGWFLACLVTVSVAVWIYALQLASPISPGSDPGNWIAISYAYIGGHYAGQVNPYGYPPLLFPILGALLLLTGSPVATGHVIVPILIVGLGLTTYALSRAILRSVILSLALVSLLLLDPYFMTLFFWGALPNLLAFVFTNLSLLGLVWTGTKGSTKGIAFFWVFGAATVLSHSLGGLGLVGIALVALFLSLFIPFQRSKAGSRASIGDAPGLLLRRLLFSAPGCYFAIVAISVVGGWYLWLHLAAVPSPGYFSPGTAPQPATFGQFLRNLLPGLKLGKLVVFYLLVILVITVLSIFGSLILYRREWISTPLLVLFSAWIAIPGIAIVGWLLAVSTDYHRFGFLLVIPAGLSIAFLVDRLWLSRAPRVGSNSTASPPAAAPSPDARLRPFPPTLRPSPQGKVAFLGLLVVILIVLAAAAASPVYVRYVKVNGGPSHDQLFLDALNAIDHSGQPGSILTVKGNLKWTWAITQRSAYAPRPGNAFLFYPIQKTDSALSYYALTSRDAVTNGLVSASLRGTSAAYVYGVPDVAEFTYGGLSATGSFLPANIQVTLVGAVNGTHYIQGLSGTPAYQPPTGTGLPAIISYVEPQFVLRQAVTVIPGSPSVWVNVSVQATGADKVAGVQEILTAPPGLGAYTQTLPATPGSFEWQPYGLRYLSLVSTGSATPSTALQGITDYYPPVGGAAAIFDFTTSGSAPAPWVNGSVDVATPLAASSIPGLPSVLNTTQIWSQLGVHFILLPNTASFTLYAGNYLLDETQYLLGEFGCSLFYANAEWIVLTVPSS